jgi:hypothetical protein
VSDDVEPDHFPHHASEHTRLWEVLRENVPSQDISLSAADLFELVGCVQLTLRHAGVRPSLRYRLEALGRRLEAALPLDPLVREVAARGWHEQLPTRQ